MAEDNPKYRNEQGFTFLELLLVLSILIVLTAVILPFGEKRLHQQSEEDALKQFVATVHQSQLYAITHGERVTLKLDQGGTAYSLTGNGSETILRGVFPEGMHLGTSITFRQLDFTETGYLVKSGKMIFITKSMGQVSVTFQLERGRVVISG